MCNTDLCTARHPRPCVYFSRSNYCKFGDGCSYLHSIPVSVESDLVNDISKSKEDLKVVVTSLNIKEIEILKLEEKVKELEMKLQAKEVCPSVYLKFDLCEYSCTSQTVLKNHRSKKHKQEIMRDNIKNETLLELLQVHVVRNEEFNKSLHVTPLYP